MDYTQRLNQFTPERTWQLGDSGISWRDENSQGSIEFSAIKEVRLRFEPTRAERRRFAMRLKDGNIHLLTNIHYRGPMDFADQSNEYRAFVTAFHNRLSAANPAVRFKRGSTPGAYLGNSILTLFVLLVLMGAGVYFLMAGIFWLAGVKLLIILFYLPTVFRLLIRNKPGRYDPHHIPPALLPPAE